jgi:hypothetical protein
MVEEHPSKERPEVEGMDTDEEHPSKEGLEVECMDIMKEVVATEPEGMVLARH